MQTDSFDEFTDDGSIIIPDSPEDDFHGATIIQSSPSDENQPDKTPKGKNQTPTLKEKHPLWKLKHARKRSAREASLPDSISDSERPYGGYKQTRGSIKISVQHKKVASESAKSRRPSQIPRPINVAHLRGQSYHAGSPTPRLVDLAKKLEASSPVFDSLNENSPLEIGRIQRKDTQQEPPGPSEKKIEQTGLSSLGLKVPYTPTKNNAGVNGPAGNDDTKSEVSDGNASTVASCATPRDIQDILDSYGSTDEGVDHTENSPAVHIRPDYSPQAWSATSGEPRILYEDGLLSIVCPPSLHPGIFRATVVLRLALEKGSPRGWLNFVIPGLPRLQDNDSGYLYFWTPPGQGLEVRTMHLRRYTMVESCMMGQFPICEKLVIPVRPCDGQFYGFLKDFQVNQTIRTDIVRDEGEDMSVVKYHAVCSINIIQRAFWAEKCGLTLYIYGGPDGEFSCHLHEPRDRTQTIHLKSVPGNRIGISDLQIVCSPRILNMFSITWEALVPRASASVWMPRIRSSMDTVGNIGSMQSRYSQAEEEGSNEVFYVAANPTDDMLCRTNDLIDLINEGAEITELTENTEKPESRWKGIKWVILSILLGLVLSRFGLHMYNSDYPFGPFMTASNTTTVPPKIDCDALADTTALTVENKSPQSPQNLLDMPLRDRIDYSLGWRGPLENFRGQVV